MNGHDRNTRLPGRVEALLSAWPELERTAFDWEAQAAATMERVRSASEGAGELDVLAPPLPLLPDEGDLPGRHRNGAASLEALELSHSNHAELRESMAPHSSQKPALRATRQEKWRGLLWGSAIALAAGSALYFGVRGGGEGATQPAPESTVAAEPIVGRPALPVVTAAFNGNIMVQARACLSSDAAAVHVNVTFTSNGRVETVSLKEPLGAEVEQCIGQALREAQVPAFSEPSFSTTVVVDPQP